MKNDFGLTLGRITGLDPAEPHFEWTPEVVRLDPSDAYYVDAIHTDAKPIMSLGLGMWEACGHKDFYPNGGRVMAGCDTGVAGAILQENGNLAYTLRRLLSCNHIRAYEFFTESINSDCQFIGVECGSWLEFYNGQCDG